VIVSPPELLWRRLAPLGWAEHELRTVSGVEPPRYATCLGTPRATEAWQDVAHASDAVARFRRVLAGGTSAGRLYALAGLRSTNSPVFAAALPGFLADNTTVPWRGRTGGWKDRRVAEVAAEISTETFIVKLTSASRMRPTCFE
jgi:hypothetical protein